MSVFKKPMYKDHWFYPGTLLAALWIAWNLYTAIRPDTGVGTVGILAFFFALPIFIVASVVPATVRNVYQRHMAAKARLRAARTTDPKAER